VTHISAPDVGSENLILLIHLKYLYQLQPVPDFDRVRLVVDRSSDHAHSLVAPQQVLDKSLFVGQDVPHICARVTHENSADTSMK